MSYENWINTAKATAQLGAKYYLSGKKFGEDVDRRELLKSAEDFASNYLNGDESIQEEVKVKILQASLGEKDGGYMLLIGDVKIVPKNYDAYKIKVETKLDTLGNKVRNFYTGNIVRHFKGNLYEIIGTAIHTETGEEMMVYKALYPDDHGQRQTFVRPYSMFIEKVDKDRHPQATQEYRLEVVEVVKV